MSEVVIMIAVSAAAFVSTSLDNLFLLMGLLAGSKLRARDAAAGYALALGVVLAIGVAGSYAADFASDGALRYLGTIPLAMGLWRAFRALRGNEEAPSNSSAGAGRGIASVFALMLANSGDSLAVYASLMSETSEPFVFVIALTALGMGALASVAARWLVRHPRLSPRLHAIERHLVPWLLVGIGLYILSDTPTDTV